MLTIPADIILEKNKLYSSEAFVELLEWQKTGGTVRIANYNEDITWGSYTWTKFRFDGGGEQDSGGDSAETVTVRVSAVDKVIQGYLEDLTNGGIGDTVVYRRVHTSDLSLGATLSATFEIVDIDAGPSSEWVTFTLGQENFFLSQFPANVFRRNVCRYRPTLTAVCSYVNNVLCKRTFADCVHFGQQSVFGGQPGIPGGAFNLPLTTEVTSTTVGLDALLITGIGASSTSLDALLLKATSTTAVLDALLIKASETLTSVFDAILITGSGSVSINLDAQLYKAQTLTSVLDAQLLEAKTLTTKLDAILITGVGVGSTNLDALLIKTKTSTASLDALILKESQTATAVIDAQLIKSNTSTTALDAMLLGSTSSTAAIDALLLEADTKTAELDALLSKANTSVSSLDALLLAAKTSTASLDALLLEATKSSAVEIDAILTPGPGVALTALDALLQTTPTIGASIDAILATTGIFDTADNAIEDTAGNIIEDTS